MAASCDFILLSTLAYKLIILLSVFFLVVWSGADAGVAHSGRFGWVSKGEATIGVILAA